MNSGRLMFAAEFLKAGSGHQAEANASAGLVDLAKGHQAGSLWPTQGHSL
jgi:hypothetical protein